MQVQQIVDFINQNRAVSGPTIGNQAGNYGSDMTMGQLGEGGVLDMAQLMAGKNKVFSNHNTFDHTAKTCVHYWETLTQRTLFIFRWWQWWQWWSEWGLQRW